MFNSHPAAAAADTIELEKPYFSEMAQVEEPVSQISTTLVVVVVIGSSEGQDQLIYFALGLVSVVKSVFQVIHRQFQQARRSLFCNICLCILDLD